MENDYYHLKTGSTITEYSFDAWGRRRNALNWSYDLTGQPALFADRGFTSHEFLSDFNLYNMNGRLYDPVVGRFLSPDPYIADPSFSQSYNRYAYALNNPLKYNDPNGELPFLAVLGIVWAGNYAIGWLDNVINKKMSPKEAFRNTNFIAGVNFSPADMSKKNNYGVSNSQISRSNSGVVLNELVQVRRDYGPEWHASNGVGELLPSWLGWTNNSINAAAYGAYAVGGSTGMLRSGAVRYYSNAWKGNQYIKTYNLTKLGTNVGYGTSALGFGFGIYNFAVSDKSWGDYGQLGVSLLSSGLTLSGYTAPIGIGIGFIDVAGGFNGFYNYLDIQQQFYNSAGGVMLPVNGIPTFIPLQKP